MIFILISLFTGAFCFFTIFTVLSFGRNENLFNNFWIVALTLVGFVRLFPFLNFVLDDSGYIILLPIATLSVYFVLPLVYLNFKKTIREQVNKSWIIHLIVPVVTSILFLTIAEIPKTYFAIFFICFYLFYMVMSARLVINYLQRVDYNLIENLRKNRIKVYLLVLLLAKLLGLIVLVIQILKFISSKENFDFNTTLALGSIGWILVLAYTILNKDLVISKSKFSDLKNEMILFWSSKSLRKIEKSDLALYDKLDVTSLIDKILNLESKYEFIKDNELDKRYISKTLKVPEYQVRLLFAYHNFLSSTEYKNAIKINQSVRLLNNGYLDSLTVDSLSQKVGFKSRITFYNNFRKFIGVSVSDYVKSVN
jgi:AraC-like DNA-binding protein